MIGRKIIINSIYGVTNRYNDIIINPQSILSISYYIGVDEVILSEYFKHKDIKVYSYDELNKLKNEVENYNRYKKILNIKNKIQYGN